TDPDMAMLTWSNVKPSIPMPPMNGAFGALCQVFYMSKEQVWPNGDPMGWDTGIIRDMATLTADKGATNPMDIVAIIGPEFIPAPTGAIKGDLSGIITP